MRADAASRFFSPAKQAAFEVFVAKERVRDLAGFGPVGMAVLIGVGLALDIFTAPAHAQVYPKQYLTTVWQTEQGLPQNSVNALLQDHDGYLWMGTFGGLARFDGERFRVFNPAGIPGLSSVSITALQEGPSGTLWIGTAGGGLAVLRHDVATTYTERDGLPSGFITSIHRDAAGNVWISTEHGVAHFDGVKLEPCRIYRGKPVSEFFLQARDGSMWFRNGRTEILRFGADGSVSTLNTRKPGAFLIHESRDGIVWIGLRDEYRLVRYSHGIFSEAPLPVVSPRELGAWVPESLLTVTENLDGELVLITPVGLVRTAGGKLTPPEKLDLPRSGDELRPKVRSLLVDREGNLWVGMIASGLVRLRPAPLTAYGKREGLADSSFNTVFQDRESRIWVGGDRLYWTDGQRFHLVPGLRDIVALAQTRDGDLWFAGYGGLYRSRSGTLSHFDMTAPLGSVIYQDRQGTLWIGAAKESHPGGLYRFGDGRLDPIPGIADVHCILENRDGGLWVAGIDGLFHVRNGEVVPFEHNRNLPRQIRTIYQDSTGTLWLSANGGGLARIRNGQVKSITARDGLPNNMLLRLLDDGQGNLWVSSLQNVFRVSFQELNAFADGQISSISPVSYGIPEGMRNSECNGGSPGIWRTKDGRIWFATIRGVSAIDPGAGSRQPAPVVLEEASANQLTLAPDGHSSAPPGYNIFDFRFTALSLSAPEKARFKYRLDPFDKGWVDAGAHRTAHYTNMAPGQYSFRVIAANSFGVWNERGAGVTFALRPHSYQTNWFYALCVATFLLILWSTYQVRIRQVHRAFERRLEERLDERTRIARELHDTLLQTTQAALIQMQAAYNLLSKRPEKAAEAIQKAITTSAVAIAEGREAIHNMRSSTVTKNDLARALRDAGDRMAAESSATFDVRVQGASRDLHPILRDDIYRIALEAMRNAFKHAEAKAVEAEILYGDSLRVRIRDDGKGIDPAILKEGRRSGHYGLPGMRERAERIGGKLDVWSGAGAGTEIQLSIPGSVAFGRRGGGSLLGRFRRKPKSEAAAQS